MKIVVESILVYCLERNPSSNAQFFRKFRTLIFSDNLLWSDRFHCNLNNPKHLLRTPFCPALSLEGDLYFWKSEQRMTSLRTSTRSLLLQSELEGKRKDDLGGSFLGIFFFLETIDDFNKNPVFI